MCCGIAPPPILLQRPSIAPLLRYKAQVLITGWYPRRSRTLLAKRANGQTRPALPVNLDYMRDGGGAARLRLTLDMCQRATPVGQSTLMFAVSSCRRENFSSVRVELFSMAAAGQGRRHDHETTVDHALMRGLDTAGPVMRRGASS